MKLSQAYIRSVECGVDVQVWRLGCWYSTNVRVSTKIAFAIFSFRFMSLQTKYSYTNDT